MEWTTILVNATADVCFVKLNRPEAKNTINEIMIEELAKVIEVYGRSCKVIVLEGNEEYFCYGADFQSISEDFAEQSRDKQEPGRLYDLWLQMTRSPCVIISHVQGTANAGGLGFVSASDIVIAGAKSAFGLSEMLFGLMPAMVMPFLIRRIGFSRMNYLTLTTKPIHGKMIYEWGLADVYSEQSDIVLRQNLARITKVPKSGIERYKTYLNKLSGIPKDSREKAIEANLEVFTDPINLERIHQFIEKGVYPWQSR